MTKSALRFIKRAKPHQLLFLCLIGLLPSQLGYHFWPDWAYIWGIKIDYLSPTIFLTDLLVLGILVLWGWEKRKELRGCFKAQNFRSIFLPLAVICFLLTNSFLAQNQPVAFYKLIKIIELALLGFYVAKNCPTFYVLRSMLPVAVIYSSLIAIAQFAKQASLGGLFYWLGERTFSLSNPGIAKAIISGRLWLRPYATFSHPNSLAGFILVSLILILGVVGGSFGIKKPRTVGPTNVVTLLRGGGVKAIRWLAFILGIITITLSFSRSAWLVGLLVATWFGLRELNKVRKSWLAVGGALAVPVVGLLVLAYFGKGLSTTEAIDQRLDLARAAILMVRDQSLIGVGLNNFIVRLPDYWQSSGMVRFLQPAHNLFLLVGSETGLIGLLVFLWFLWLTIKRLLESEMAIRLKKMKLFNHLTIQPLLLALIVILLLGFTDHYWLTLQQNQLLLAVVLGMSWKVYR